MGETIPSQRVFKRPQLDLEVVRVPVSWPVQDHGHEFQEMVYVERGWATHEVSLAVPGQARPRRAQRYALIPGDCFLIAPGEHHAFVAPRSVVVWNIFFLPSVYQQEQEALRAIPGLAEFLFIEPMFRHEGRAVAKLHLGVRERSRMLSCLEAIRSELTHGEDGWVSAARAHFITMLVTLARCWRSQRAAAPGRPAAGAGAPGQREAMDAAISFMEEHYGEDLSLGAIAEQAFLSPHHFSETFKRHCGIPPWEFLLQVRLERGKELLRSTTRSVTDIALSVGFGDSSYFARVFKAATGQTPRAWRAQEPGTAAAPARRR